MLQTTILPSGRLFISNAQTVVLALQSVLTMCGATVVVTQVVNAQEQKPQAASADVFPLPLGEAENNIEALFRFAEEMSQQVPEGESEAEQSAHQRKIARTIAHVGAKVLTLEPNDEQALQGHFFRLQAFAVLRDLGEPKADESLEKAIAVARADRRPDVAAKGMEFLLKSSFGKWHMLDDQKKTSVMDDVVDYLSSSKLEPYHVQMLDYVSQNLSDLEDYQQASKLLGQSLPLLRKSDQPIIQQAVAMFEGLERRFNLPGNKMEIHGTLLDGTEIDWASYRGKIVLVDFWATWCGPCQAELPNVLKLYKAYHDKGFDVVGICLDDKKDKESVETFIEKMKLPWANIFSPEKTDRGWEHPLASYYGITGVPRAILVDREGTVVDMNARGQQLARQLRKRLGEPLAKVQRQDDSLVRRVSGTSTVSE